MLLEECDVEYELSLIRRDVREEAWEEEREAGIADLLTWMTPDEICEKTSRYSMEEIIAVQKKIAAVTD